MAGSLDYEARSSYSLTVRASDGRGGTDTATVSVSLSNVAEPLVSAPSPVSASEGSGSFSLSWRRVTGAGMYRYEYSVGGAAWEGTRETSSTSAGITPSKNEILPCTVYAFRVRAMGDGSTHSTTWGPWASTSLTSRPAPGQSSCTNSPPFFGSSTYSETIPETSSTGTNVIRVTATDSNNDPISFSITGGNTGSKFSINSSSGWITVAGSLDYEARSSYSLTVRASDGRGGTDTATVSVSLSNVAEPLVSAPSPVSASEGSGSFSLSWRRVTGADMYRYEYSVGGAAWEGTRETSSTSAGITPSKNEILPCTVYAFRVRAMGDGSTHSTAWGPWASTSLTSRPAPGQSSCTNSPPFFGSSTYSETIPETSSTGTNVIRVTATDSNNDPISFSITGGNTGSKFSINSSSGWITVAGSLDYEARSSYSLTVRASDGRGGTDTATVSVSLSNVAEPLVSAPSPVSASEGSGSFSLSWRRVTGADMYRYEYSVGGAAWEGTRETSSTSAGITPSKNEILPCTVYAFRVRAMGDGSTHSTAWGPWASTSLTSRPAPGQSSCTNSPPFFGSSTYSETIPETSSTGTNVIRVTATDSNNDPISFSITGGNTGSKFSINSSSGWITVAGSLDYEARSSYSLTVRASDGRGGTDTATVSVSLSNVAEPLVSAPSPVSASEGSGSFSLSWRRVTGADMYRYEYSVGGAAWEGTRETSSTSAGITPSKNEILPCTVYAFRVRAMGDGSTHSTTWGPWASTSLTSRPAPGQSSCENDPPASNSPPLIDDQDPYENVVREDADIGKHILEIVAEDPDGDHITFAIVSGNVDSTFAITTPEEGTGEITLARHIDFETDTVTTYRLTVEASDGRGGTDMVDVRITVKDIIVATMSVIERNLDIGRYYTLTVAITDYEGEVTYQWQEFLNDRWHDRSTASAYEVTRQLPGQVTYRVLVTGASGAMGRGGPRSFGWKTPPGPPPRPELAAGNASMTVSWERPENDGGAFPDQYRIQYRERGTMAWTETDPLPPESSTDYPIAGLTNGLIYEVQVQAHNFRGWGDWSPTATVELPADNDPPEFGRPSYSFDVREDASIGDSVGVVTATDPDEDDSVSYSIPSGNDDGKFSIDSSSGEITVAGMLDYDTTSSYMLTVDATDEDDATSTVTVQIAVTAPITSVSITSTDNLSPVAGASVTLDAEAIPARTYTYQWQERLNGLWDNVGGEVSVTDLTASSVSSRSRTLRVMVRHDSGSEKASDGVTVKWRLGPPLGVSATSIEGGFTASWSPPSAVSAAGGVAPSHYNVRYGLSGSTDEDGWPVSSTGSGSDTSLDVTGLDSGEAYEYQVQAVNSVGDGEWSEREEVDAAATAPGKTSTPTVVSGDGVLNVSWAAPSDGGAPITAYQVRYGNKTTQGWILDDTLVGEDVESRMHELDDLMVGLTYEVQVQAMNSVGWGEWSDSASAEVNSSPGAPLNVTIASGNETLTVTWSQPSTTGGLSIDKYRVRHRLLPSGSWTEPVELAVDSVPPRTHTIQGLENGNTYEVQVQAHNYVGWGRWSDAESVMLDTEPGTPENLRVLPGDRILSVTWSRPSNAVGSETLEYRVQYRKKLDPPGGVWTPSTLDIASAKGHTIRDLTNGVTYEVQVNASNGVHTGGWSEPPVEGTPDTLPGAPEITSVEPGDEELTITWTEPQNSGSAITGYKIEYYAAKSDTTKTVPTGTGTSFTISAGLRNGFGYTIRVAAVNGAGTGPWSEPPVEGMPRTTPGPPRGHRHHSRQRKARSDLEAPARGRRGCDHELPGGVLYQAGQFELDERR